MEIERETFPQEYERYLKRVRHYTLLDESMRERLHKRVLCFIRKKEFIGVGMEIDDEVRVLISFYACLMTLGMENECYDILRTIIVYPYRFIYEKVTHESWIYHKEELLVEGESMGESVVIVWHEARREALHPSAHNVSIHEFAHELDMEDGYIDGMPPLPFSKQREWSDILYRRYKALEKRVKRDREWGAYAMIGEYAATDEAEFFAVTVELFFQKPRSFKKHFPDIYREYREFFGLDTAELFAKL